MCGRGSKALAKEANPDEVVMAPAKPEPDFVGKVGGAGLEPATSCL
jgi:hypothetical protein